MFLDSRTFPEVPVGFCLYSLVRILVLPSLQLQGRLGRRDAELRTMTLWTTTKNLFFFLYEEEAGCTDNQSLAFHTWILGCTIYKTSLAIIVKHKWNRHASQGYDWQNEFKKSDSNIYCLQKTYFRFKDTDTLKVE